EVPPAARALDVDRAAKIFGFYFDGHPLDWLENIGRQLGLTPLSQVIATSHSASHGQYRCAVRVDAIRKRHSQAGSPYAFVTVSDTTGAADVLVFSEVLSLAAPVMQVGEIVVLDIARNSEGGASRLMLNKAESVAELLSRLPATL